MVFRAPTMILPPAPPLLGSAYEQERYRERVKEFEKSRKDEERARRKSFWISVLVFVAMFGGFVYLLTRLHHSAEVSSKLMRETWIANNRAAISSCLSRGGYVIEDSQGWLKECRGVQRAP